MVAIIIGHLQVKTSSLERPPTSDHMFGYSYSGFLTIQKAVDEFIISRAAGERVYLNVSMGFFPEQVAKLVLFAGMLHCGFENGKPCLYRRWCHRVNGTPGMDDGCPRSFLVPTARELLLCVWKGFAK